MNFREIHYEFRLNFSLLGHLFSLWEELNKAEREGLINRCEPPLVGEVGLNSARNEDQPFSTGLWHKPGLMVMGQGRTIRHESISNELWKSWKLGWYHNFTHIACACTKWTMVACSCVTKLAWYHHNSCGRKSSLFLRLCHLLIAP